MIANRYRHIEVSGSHFEIGQQIGESLKEELTDLKELFDGQLISQVEYDAQRAVIMKKHGMGT